VTSFRLDGRCVAVVGASGGIGAACAVACAEAGAEAIALLGRDEERLAAVADDVGVAGATASVVPCDLASTESIRAAFARLDRLDVLVNAAGANRPEPFADVTAETFDRLFALNVRGAFFAAQEAVRLMRAAGDGGTIVTISSQMGHVGARDRTVYSATKHAVEGFTKALAVELAPERIRVVTVAPTFVRTAMTAAQLDDDEVGPRLLAQIPLGRFGSPAEVAGAVVYSASPAAALVTGTSLVLDGGWTAR